MSTVKFISEICFQLVPFNLKYINVTQFFTGNGISGKCFHKFHFWKISLAWSTRGGKSYSYHEQTNAAFQVVINVKNCSSDIHSFDSFRSKLFAKVILRFKSFSLNEHDLWFLPSVFLMEMFDSGAKSWNTRKNCFWIITENPHKILWGFRICG